MRRFFSWFLSMDEVVLLTVLAMLLGIWVFILVAHAVSVGSTQDLDEWLLRALRTPGDLTDPLGPKWLEEMGRDLTALGGVAALTLTTAVVAGYLFICRKYRALVFLLVATLGGLVLSTLLKEFFARPRPNIVPHLSIVESSSFPSGHSMLSAVVYLTLGSLLARLVERRLQIYFLSVAILVSILVGVSRVYMGVHYPTDVLAGWSAGLAWALLCNLVARWLQYRGAVEKSVTRENNNENNLFPHQEPVH